MTLEDQIKTLTARNIEVLFLLCEKKTEREIGAILHIKEKAVQNHLTRIYEYLGWKELSNEEKEFKLGSEICPIVKKYIKKREDVNDWIKHPKKKTATTEEALLQEPTIPDLKPKPDPLIEPLKARSEKARSESEATITPLPPVSGTYETPPPPRRALPRPAPRHRLWIIGGIIVVILLCLVVSRNPGVLGIASLQSPTPTRTKIPTAVRTPRPIKTEGPSPTPTDTPTPTITPTPIPLPFYDDFTNGIRPEWIITGEPPFILNGWLVTKGVTKISVGNSAWKNYKLEFDFDWWQDDRESSVSIRTNNDNNERVMFWFTPESSNKFVAYTNEGTTELMESGNYDCPGMFDTRAICTIWSGKDGYGVGRPAKVEIIAQDNVFKLIFGGNLVNESILPEGMYPTSGGVTFDFYWDTKLDNIRISPLP